MPERGDAVIRLKLRKRHAAAANSLIADAGKPLLERNHAIAAKEGLKRFGHTVL